MKMCGFARSMTAKNKFANVIFKVVNLNVD